MPGCLWHSNGPCAQRLSSPAKGNSPAAWFEKEKPVFTIIQGQFEESQAIYQIKESLGIFALLLSPLPPPPPLPRMIETGLLRKILIQGTLIYHKMHFQGVNVENMLFILTGPM